MTHTLHGMAFSTWLVGAMQEAGISRRELQQRTRVSRGTVDGWIKGVVPNFDNVNKIANALGADVVAAQKAAGHIVSQDQSEAQPIILGPLSEAEVAELRDILAHRDPDRVREYRRVMELIGDMSPAAWRALRRMAESVTSD